MNRLQKPLPQGEGIICPVRFVNDYWMARHFEFTGAREPGGHSGATHSIWTQASIGGIVPPHVPRFYFRLVLYI